MAYTPPGVQVNELTSPSVAPLLAVPASVCIVGLAGPSASATPPGGVIQKTDTITLTGTTGVVLPSVPTTATMVSTSILSVMNVNDPGDAPSGYTVTTDYTFNTSTHAIARVGGGTIADGSTVQVTYTYTPADFYSPIRLTNMSDIEDRFGSAWNTAKTAIHSPLSHAAMLAFENGAQDLVLMPLFHNNSGTRQQPTDAQAAAQTAWDETFVVLRDIEDINVIVPVIGQSMTSVGASNQLNVIQAVQDHLRFMKGEQQYLVAIVAEDSSGSYTVPKTGSDSIQTHATTVAARYGGEMSEQMVYLSPTKFQRPLPASSGTLAVGGQYAAAAVAGMIASRPVSSTLTRKAISGLVAVTDSRTKAEMNADANLGLCVIEQRGSIVMVRHAVTMDTTNTASRELSIVRAKHRVIESVRDTIETQIIGRVVADGEAPLVVRSAIIGTLDGLRAVGDIVNFANVQARTLSLDPTHIEVRFSYRPAFPVNYVTVNFSLDLTTGQVRLPDTTQVNS